jgi:hypothetical protein
MAMSESQGASQWIYVTVGAAEPLKFDPAGVVDAFKQQLEKKMGKKGQAVTFGGPESAIKIALHLEPGNRLLRYLFPFIAPAEVYARAEVAGANGQKQVVEVKGVAQIGLFGGSTEGMLKTAAGAAAGRLSKQLLGKMGGRA